MRFVLLIALPLAAQVTLPPGADEELRQAAAEIDRIESETLAHLDSTTRDEYGRIVTLGKLLLYDKELSVNRNEACALCHMPETGYTGPSATINKSTVSYPGSDRARFSQRKPQSYNYSTFSPVLHYNEMQGDFVGGNFWDMRATGLHLQNPAAEQAQGPPTNPVEMGLPDIACVVYRISRRSYRALFERVWGAQAFAIRWPTDVEKVCSTPAPSNNPMTLNAADRGRAMTTYDQMGLSIAAHEGSYEVSPFNSKYDFVQAGKAQFTPQEKNGYDLFRGKARCNECHRDGGPGEEPLFTDFTASNLGVPKNPSVAYYFENKPDQFGYAANPAGATYIDPGVGGFLQKSPTLSGKINPNNLWIQYAQQFIGKFQVPTLRDVDQRPRPDFVKAYMHNGYFKSLTEVVHFYNTRDTLRRCSQGDPGEKVSCWPAPEDSRNLNKRQLGNLGLTSQEEDAIVAFLKTLTDQYKAATKGGDR